MIKDHLVHVLVSAFRYETSRHSGLTMITCKAIIDNIDSFDKCYHDQFKQDLRSHGRNPHEQILLDKILELSK